MQSPPGLTQRDQACVAPDVGKELHCSEPLKPCSPANELCDTSKSNDLQKQDQQFSAQDCALPLDAVRKHLTCQLCNELVAASLVMQCSHVFCGECLYNYLNTKAQCPTCQVQMRAIPVRCLSLDAVTSAYVAKMDNKHQASFESRTEDGRHAANKMNKMFWWLQSTMAVPGAETSDSGLGHMPHNTTSAQPSTLNSIGNNSAACQPMMQHLSPAAAAAAVLGGMGMAGQPNSIISNGVPNRTRTPCLPGAMNQCLPPQPRHSSSFTGPGSIDRISRPSQDGNLMMNGQQLPAMGMGLHRRNSEGSGMPVQAGYPPRHIGNASMAPPLTGRRSFCNGESLPLAPAYGAHQLPSNVFNANFMPPQSAALMNHINPFLSTPPLPSTALNALAELQKQYNAGAFMKDYSSASIANTSAVTLQEQAIAQLIMQQQQMYLG